MILNKKNLILPSRLIILLFIASSFPAAAQELPPIKIAFASKFLTAEGKVLGYIGEKNRVDIRGLSSISPHVVNCLIATEDREFYNHDGVSYKGLLRGILKTLTAQPQGGSTITMQLARNLFLTNERTVSRKITEIDLAKKLEAKFSKNEILLMYLNVVYFGNNSYGIFTASQKYYNKHPKDLSVAESAALIGLLKNPNGYDPRFHPDRMLKRRNEVLYNLVEVGKLSTKEFSRIKQNGLALNMNDCDGDYFLEYARRQAVEILKHSGKTLSGDELTIYTTAGYDIQKAAADAIRSQWDKMPGAMKKAQTGLISIEHTTGRIRAMIGGNPEANPRGLNRATQIRRQPGSSFKPFLYGAMLDSGFTLATPLLDSAIVVNEGQPDEWRPSNAENASTGTYIPMGSAIENSVNLCAAYAITRLISPDSVISFARRLGITSPIPPYPSIALGSAEVSPIEMAAAFGVFASAGTLSKPFCITRIEDKRGQVLFADGPALQIVLDTASAILMTDALEKVVNSGTATAIRNYYRGFAAGKTGTTNDYTDAWFVGYNRVLSTAVWVGFDSPSHKLRAGYNFGGSVAAPVWGRFYGYLGSRSRDFRSPPDLISANIVEIELCAETGLPASPECPKKVLYRVNAAKLPGNCGIHSALW